MAILFLDGCQHLSTQQIITKYDVASNYVSGDILSRLSITRLGLSASVYKKSHTFANTGIFGVNFSAVGVQSYVAAGVNQLFTTAGVNGNKIAVLEFRDTAGEAVIRVAGSSGQVVLDVGSGYTSVAAATGGNVASVWNLWEVEASYGATAVCRVYLSGVVLISYTGSILTSANTGITRAYWSWMRLATTHNGHIHDFYVINNAGPAASTLIGSSMQVRTHVVSGDTGTVQWSPASGSTHYTHVDEGSGGDGHDGTATYVSANAANLRDLLSVASAAALYSASEVPRGVQVNAVALGTAGSLNLLVQVSGGTALSHTTTSAVSTAFQVHRAVFTSAPGGGTWQASSIDNLAIGIESL